MKSIFNILFPKHKNTKCEKEKSEIPIEAEVQSRKNYVQFQGGCSYDLVFDIVSQEVEGDVRIIKGMPAIDYAGNLQGKPIIFLVPANVKTFMISIRYDLEDDVSTYEPKNFILESYADFMKHERSTPIYRGE